MMRAASSLTNRIFLASTLLAVLALGFALYFVNARVSEEAEADLRRSVNEAATLIDRRQQDLIESFTAVARIVAEVPQLKAAVATGDPPTVQPMAERIPGTAGRGAVPRDRSNGRGAGGIGSGSRQPQRRRLPARIRLWSSRR